MAEHRPTAEPDDAPPPGAPGTPGGLLSSPRVRVKAYRNGVVVMSFPRTRFDSATLKEMYHGIAQITARGHARVLVDLADVPLISSQAMGMLLTMHKHCNESGGRLHVYVPRGDLMGPFRLMKLDRVLHLYGDRAEAMKAFDVMEGDRPE
jgi:anti-anti-sigma factor